jgi:hypothetical protein
MIAFLEFIAAPKTFFEFPIPFLNYLKILIFVFRTNRKCIIIITIYSLLNNLRISETFFLSNLISSLISFSGKSRNIKPFSYCLGMENHCSFTTNDSSCGLFPAQATPSLLLTCTGPTPALAQAKQHESAACPCPHLVDAASSLLGAA